MIETVDKQVIILVPRSRYRAMDIASQSVRSSVAVMEIDLARLLFFHTKIVNG